MQKLDDYGKVMWHSSIIIVDLPLMMKKGLTELGKMLYLMAKKLTKWNANEQIHYSASKESS